MAVQAQFPSNPPFLRFPHFRPSSRARADDVSVDEINMIHDRDLLLRAHAHAHAQFDAVYGNNSNSGGGGAGAEQSELVMLLPPQNGPVPIEAGVVAPAIEVVVGGASTSGRAAGQDVASQLHRQSAEIDALVRLENEKLRWGLEECRRRHGAALASAAGRGVERRLRGKEAEVERARRRNAALEARVRELAAENDAWLGLARANESAAAALRASLDRLLLGLHTTTSTSSTSSSSSSNHPLLARRQCRACGEGEACVLLLPCRHLCACERCAAEIAACPVCRHVKNACLRVLISTHES